MSRPLSNYCTLKGGTGFPESLQGNQEGDVAFIKVSDMSLPGNQRTITVANNYVDRVVAEQLNASAFPPRSTVFAKVGAALLLNRRRMLIEPTIIDNNMMAAVPTIADPEFLYHFLCSVDFANYVQMGALPSINQSTIGQIPFPEFSLSQQCRIAEILSTVDEAIEQTEALIAKYQQIKAGLMHDLFTRGLTPNGHLRPTRAQAPQLYKESPLGWIPKEWEVSNLRDKSSPVRPHIKTGPFGSSLKGEHWVENGRPVITIGALGEGELLTESLLFVSEATAHRLREYQLQPGDVVFSRVADVGRSAVICEEHDGWIMSSNLMRISLNQNLIVPGYLQAQFAFDYRVKAQIRAKVNSGGRDVANGQILNQVQFAWPRQEEQDVALKRIRTLDANRRSVTDQQTKLLKLKHGLMHDLLTGRVRVKVGQPAST